MAPEQKLSRRSFLRLAAGVTGAATLAACSGSGTPSTGQTAGTSVAAGATTVSTAVAAAPAAPTRTPAPTVVINAQAVKSVSFWVLWGSPSQAQAFQDATAAFGQANPTIGVKLTPGVDTFTKLLPAITAGNPPDVTHVFYVAGLAAKNALLPLDDFIERSSVIKKEMYTDSQWAAVTWKGKRYAIPGLENGPGIGMAWNKTLFKQAGLDPAKGPTSLDELLQFHDKLTQIDPNGNLRVLGVDPLDAVGGTLAFFNLWLNTAGIPYVSADGTKLNLNDPKIIEGAQFVTDMYKKIGADKITGFRSNFGKWTGPNSAFAQGKQGIQFNGYWTPGELSKAAAPGQEFGYGWIPVRSGKTFMLTGGHSMAIPRGAQDPDTAFKLIEFMTTPEAGQKVFNGTGFLNGNLKFFQTGDFSAAPDVKWFLQAMSQAEVTSSQPPPLLVAQELETRLGKTMDQVTRGEVGAKDAFDTLQSQMQSALDEQLQ